MNKVVVKKIYCMLILSAILLFGNGALAAYEDSFQALQITSAELSVREMPSVWVYGGVGELQSAIISVLKKGDTVYQMGEFGAWTHIAWRDGEKLNFGYIYSKYTKKSGTVYRYANKQVNIFSRPDAGSDAIGSLNLGDAIAVSNTYGKWAEVDIDGENGYVYKKDIVPSRFKTMQMHPIVDIVGKKNIKNTYYTYRPRGLDNIETKLPVLEITYEMKTKLKDDIFMIIVYRYHSEADAQQVKKDIGNFAVTPGVPWKYYLKGDTIIGYWQFGMDFTDASVKYYSQIRSAIESHYGKILPYANVTE